MYSVAIIAESGKVPKNLAGYIKGSDQYNVIGLFPNCVVALNALTAKSPQIVMIYTHMAFWSTERFIQTAIQRGITAQFVLIGDEPDDSFYIPEYGNRISASVFCANLSYETVMQALAQAKEDWDAYNNPAWSAAGKARDVEELSCYLTEIANGGSQKDGLQSIFQEKDKPMWLLWGIAAEKDLFVERQKISELLKSINYYLIHDVGGISTMLWKDTLCCFVECKVCSAISLQYAHPLQRVAETISSLLQKSGLPSFQFFSADKPILIQDFWWACRQMESLQKYTFFSNHHLLMWPAWLNERAGRSSMQISKQYISGIAEAVRSNNMAMMHEAFRQLKELVRQAMSFPFYAAVWNSLVILHYELARDHGLPSERYVLDLEQNGFFDLEEAAAEIEQRFVRLAVGIAQVRAVFNPIIQSAVSYLKAHFSEKMTLEAVAKEAHASVSHVSRLFKSEMGLTFTEYLNGLRIERSKQLLAAKMPVQQVSEEVGFENPKYFSKVFRKMTGQSPAQYRKLCGHSEEEPE